MVAVYVRARDENSLTPVADHRTKATDEFLPTFGDWLEHAKAEIRGSYPGASTLECRLFVFGVLSCAFEKRAGEVAGVISDVECAVAEMLLSTVDCLRWVVG